MASRECVPVWHKGETLVCFLSISYLQLDKCMTALCRYLACVFVWPAGKHGDYLNCSTLSYIN